MISRIWSLTLSAVETGKVSQSVNEPPSNLPVEKPHPVLASDHACREYWEASFNKRARTVLSKAHDLAALCGAKVYVLIDHPRGLVAYSSQDVSWPPFDDAMLHSVQWFSRSAMEHTRENAHQRELVQLYKFLHCKAQLLQSVNQQPEETGVDLRSEHVSLG